MLTLVDRGFKRWIGFHIKDGKELWIEIDYHYSHQAWMVEVTDMNAGRRVFHHYHIDTPATAAGIVSCFLGVYDYRLVDKADLLIEHAILDEQITEPNRIFNNKGEL